jgi:HNH endonuclease/NUMOD4 motif-containing protein
MDERWLPVVGFEGYYKVSDLGRVWSVPRRNPRNNVRYGGKILKPDKMSAGHLRVSLHIGNKVYRRFVHRLVLGAFVGECPEGMQVRHLNGNPADNRLENLIYGTFAENMKDRDERHKTNYQLNKTHCPRGHEYTEENTYRYLNKNGGRGCRACAREWQRTLRKRRRDERNNPGTEPRQEELHC